MLNRISASFEALAMTFYNSSVTSGPTRMSIASLLKCSWEGSLIRRSCNRSSHADLLTPPHNFESDDGLCELAATLIDVYSAAARGDGPQIERHALKLPKDLLSSDMLSEILSLDRRAIGDTLSTLKAASAVCEDPTDRTRIESFLRNELDQETRTCKLFINSWTNQFRQISDSIWSIVQDGPQGSCGVIRLDRFECRSDHPTLCDFVSEKRVMAPGAMGVMPCNNLDESVTRYAPGYTAMYLDCEMLRF